MTLPVPLIPAVSTWDILAADGGARRPSLNDVGGCELVEDAIMVPPTNGTQLYKLMLEQWQRQLYAVAKTIPSATITLDFSAGTPFIDKLMAPGTLHVPSGVGATFLLTDNANGDTTITWASWRLPPFEAAPTGTVNDLVITSPTVQVDVVAAAAGFSAVRVKTKDAGTLRDLRVTIEIR
jgi:hypothetical protein